MVDLKNLSSFAMPEVPSQRIWQWRPRRWKVALIIMAIVLVAGSAIIPFLPEEYNGNSDVIYNFNFVVLLLFAIWTVFSEREWPIWKRILWIFGLWLAHGFMQFIPFGIITGPVGNYLNNAFNRFDHSCNFYDAAFYFFCRACFARCKRKLAGYLVTVRYQA
jgi:hypothetical protein